MTAVKPASDMPPAAAREPRRWGWRLLLATAALTGAGTFLAAAAALGDLEAAAYGVAYAVGAALLLLANLNVVVWMSLGALSNVTAGQRLVFVVVPALLTGLAFAGAASAAVVLVRPDTAARRAPAAVAGAAVLVVVAVSGAAVFAGGEAAATTDVVRVTSDNVLFVETELTAPPGAVTVRMTNADLFWHTFTIDELGVDLWVPVGGERDATFDAPAGTYDYYCRIPGHEARMRGTLVVG